LAFGAGRLTFGGEHLNKYVRFSIATRAELLSENSGSKGLITANGGHLYNRVHAIYSSEGPAQDFQHKNVQDTIDLLPARECIAGHTGKVTIESYTVMYDQGAAAVGYFACRTPDSTRIWARTFDNGLMQSMGEEEFCGCSAMLSDTEISAQ